MEVCWRVPVEPFPEPEEVTINTADYGTATRIDVTFSETILTAPTTPVGTVVTDGTANPITSWSIAAGVLRVVVAHVIVETTTIRFPDATPFTFDSGEPTSFVQDSPIEVSDIP